MDIDNGISIFPQGNEHYYIGNADTLTEKYDFIISLHQTVALERHHLGIIMDALKTFEPTETWAKRFTKRRSTNYFNGASASAPGELVHWTGKHGIISFYVNKNIVEHFEKYGSELYTSCTRHGLQSSKRARKVRKSAKKSNSIYTLIIIIFSNFSPFMMPCASASIDDVSAIYNGVLENIISWLCFIANLNLSPKFRNPYSVLVTDTSLSPIFTINNPFVIMGRVPQTIPCPFENNTCH